jgi:hypothetical protein
VLHAADTATADKELLAEERHADGLGVENDAEEEDEEDEKEQEAAWEEKVGKLVEGRFIISKYASGPCNATHSEPASCEVLNHGLTIISRNDKANSCAGVMHCAGTVSANA